MPERLQRIEAAGFEGIEAPIADIAAARAAGWTKPAIGMAFVELAEALKKDLDQAAKHDLESVTVHAGRHRWTPSEGAKFFDEALRVVEASKLKVNFETHRGRLLYEPVQTAEYVRQFPELHLVADFSHWACVTESLLGDQDDHLQAAIPRVRHLHARVGHEEGPQVPDPRSERWSGHVEAFGKMWDRIRQAHIDRGEAEMTVDPEFGPPNYLWSDPVTGRPLADLFDVCVWMRDTLRTRWN
jgi:sugar phosphate isomerase/epimerase